MEKASGMHKYSIAGALPTICAKFRQIQSVDEGGGEKINEQHDRK